MRTLLLMALASGALRLSAQDAALSPGETQAWMSLELEWRPIKRWTFSGAYVMRTFGAFQGIKGNYYYLAARRKLNDHLFVDAKLRYVDTPREAFYRSEVGVRVQQRFGKDVLYFRTAFFHEEPQPFWSDGPSVADNFWRNRLRFRKDLPKRYSAYLSVESWTRFRYDGNSLRRAALMTGLRRDLKRGREIAVDYLFQPEFNQRQPRSMSAVIVGFSWDVTKPKKKKKRSPERAGEGREQDDGREH
ncbi:MAG: hypothetical protein KF797_08510 [Flavobacteriales bacterium]|nr:hypothetical protein [Flavobacteriales bacterium]